MRFQPCMVPTCIPLGGWQACALLGSWQIGTACHSAIGLPCRDDMRGRDGPDDRRGGYGRDGFDRGYRAHGRAGSRDRDRDRDYDGYRGGNDSPSYEYDRRGSPGPEEPEKVLSKTQFIKRHVDDDPDDDEIDRRCAITSWACNCTRRCVSDRRVSVHSLMVQLCSAAMSAYLAQLSAMLVLQSASTDCTQGSAAPLSSSPRLPAMLRTLMKRIHIDTGSPLPLSPLQHQV